MGSMHKQVHDINGGVQPSGLFWVVELDDKNVDISNDGRRASMRASNIPVVDSFTFGGPVEVPAMVSFSFEWRAIGPFEEHGERDKVQAPPPTDPSAFTARLAPAFARGTFSGRELSFSFRSIGDVTSADGYALMGRESNGSLMTRNP